jgi:hypothetical protein
MILAGFVGIGYGIYGLGWGKPPNFRFESSNIIAIVVGISFLLAVMFTARKK